MKGILARTRDLMRRIQRKPKPEVECKKCKCKKRVGRKNYRAKD